METTDAPAVKKPTALRGGPYRGPECQPGDRLVCRVVGARTVEGFTDAPVPWPYYWRPLHGLRPFVCGDFERALACEQRSAISATFGVKLWTVDQWRKQLAIVPSFGLGRPRKVTDEQVEAIRARTAAGEKRGSLAREYGICESYLSQLVRDRSRLPSTRRPNRPSSANAGCR
jgi:hypothetical protein